MQCGRVGSRLLFIRAFIWAIKWTLFLFMSLMGLPQIPPQMVWHFRALRKSFPEWFEVSAHGESHFLKGLEFPRLAKVVSRKVWSFRAWRKSFPERFDVSAHGESRFPKGLVFPRMAKVISRKVWCFRAWRKLFPEWFGDMSLLYILKLIFVLSKSIFLQLIFFTIKLRLRDFYCNFVLLFNLNKKNEISFINFVFSVSWISWQKMILII